MRAKRGNLDCFDAKSASRNDMSWSSLRAKRSNLDCFVATLLAVTLRPDVVASGALCLCERSSLSLRAKRGNLDCFVAKRASRHDMSWSSLRAKRSNLDCFDVKSASRNDMSKSSLRAERGNLGIGRQIASTQRARLAMTLRPNVVASAVRQSGLLRRYAPRNDMSKSSLRAQRGNLDCFVATLLAMT